VLTPSKGKRKERERNRQTGKKKKWTRRGGLTSKYQPQMEGGIKGGEGRKKKKASRTIRMCSLLTEEGGRGGEN